MVAAGSDLVVLQTEVHLGTMYLEGLVGLLSWSVKGVVAFEWAAAAIIIRALYAL